MRRIAAAFGVGVLVAVVAAGCAGQGGDAGQPVVPLSGSPEVHPAWHSCAAEAGPSAAPDLGDGNDALGLPRLDGSFTPVLAIVCATAVERRTDGGQDLVSTESRAENVTALLAALRLSDEPMTNAACTMELPLIPRVVLLDQQGRWIRPGVPRDACGKIRIEVRDAVRQLRLTRTSARPVRQVESAEAAAAGCSQQWGDMVWVTAGTSTAQEPADVGPLFDGPAQVRLCAYRVPASEQRTSKPAGDFAYGRTLSDAQWAAVRQEVRKAPPETDCTTPASRFAVLLTDAGEVYVELDGCKRLMAAAVSGGDTLRQASPALINLLADR